MNAVTLSTKGQVVIPKALREALGLRPGQRLGVVPHGNVISLVPLGPREELFGLVAGADTSELREHEDRLP